MLSDRIVDVCSMVLVYRFCWLLILLALLFFDSFTVDSVDYCNFHTITRLINTSILTIYLFLNTRRSYGF
jgi:hypothetical protein